MYCGDIATLRHDVPTRTDFDVMTAEIEAWLSSRPRGMCNDGYDTAHQALALLSLLYDYYEEAECDPSPEPKRSPDGNVAPRGSTPRGSSQ